MKRLHIRSRLSGFAALWLSAAALRAQTPEPGQPPQMSFEVLTGFFQLPPGENIVEAAGVAVNSQGHIYLFHRGKHPLMEFDPSGKFLRSISDDLFVTPHMIRVDGEDHIWTTDVGSHVVLKLDPDGRVLLPFGRMRLAGDDVSHFNQPTDVAFDRAGNIYVTDGYGNSRVLKFDKHGVLLQAWGTKGPGPGQFDLPHTIAIDDELVYVGDRENARIQIFDTQGRFLREWHLGHPFGLFITPDHSIYECDAIAGTILKIDRSGKIVGSFALPEESGRRLDAHEIAVGRDGSIYAAEVQNWRVLKLRPR
jgi:DNA-binding beta-propeller fold protein YncE